MRFRLVLIALSIMVLVTPAANAQFVQRRGGEATLYGDITDVTEAGVTIRSNLGATHFVPWDRVRSVTSPAHEAMVERHMETATQLWRARSRVERNDTVLAEPLFERLFEQFRGQSHETALVVAEGLLRCRLARGAQALAIAPAMEVTRLRRSGVETQSYRHLPAVYDETHDLCPTLAPYWMSSPALPRAAQDLVTYETSDDEVTTAIARLYRISVERAMGEATESIDDESLPDHAGVRLLSTVIQAGSDDATRRAGARNALLGLASNLPPFGDAWARFHIGVSYLRESGEVRQQRGMLNLLHVPALHGGTQPYLAGIALRLTADALDARGDTDAAQLLRSELITRYPLHPAAPGSARRPDHDNVRTDARKEHG